LSKDFEELEKQFILTEDMEQEDLKNLIRRIQKLCKIDNNGYVIIRKTNLSNVQQILLVLSARYLGNRLQLKLNRDITIFEICKIKELSEMLKVKDAVITARLKELKDKKKVISPDRGEFKIPPYEIKDLLEELEGQRTE
jgi:DNA-binding transcriptional ArsR family regulator